MTETIGQDRQAIAVQAGDGRQLWHRGWLLQVKVTGADTDGTHAVIEELGGQGAAPPPHVHEREDESLYVLDGAIEAMVGGTHLEAETGGFVYLPRGVPHTFRVTSTTARLLLVVAPAGFEQFFLETGTPATAATLPPPDLVPDFDRLVAVLDHLGVRLLGP